MSRRGISFESVRSDEFVHLRAGKLVTHHGTVRTPVYMPVGTYGPVRLIDSLEMREAGAEIVLGNSLHLEMTAGSREIEALGGLARFTSWDGPTLTDSGGYQVSYWWRSGTHSLESGERKHATHSPVERITSQGARIRSLTTGQPFWLTPEGAMEIQGRLGADIVMAFDQPTFDTDAYDKALESLQRSHSWVDRSFKHWDHLKQTGGAAEWQELFPIIQGGQNDDLRRRSTDFALGFDAVGIAIAGESIGIVPQISAKTIDSVRDLLPSDRPLYAMGLGGGPEGFLEAALRGVDMFDNTSPTRMARCGLVLIYPESGGNCQNHFRMDITKGRFARDEQPLDPLCTCKTCKTHSRAYVRHLFRIRDPLGMRLVSFHNLWYMARLSESIHESILAGTFGCLYARWLGRPCGQTLG